MQKASSYNSGSNKPHKFQKPLKWHTIKNIFYEENNDHSLPLKIDSIIERPEYANKEMGFYRLITIISVGDYHVRLPIKYLRTIMRWLEEKKDIILEAIDEVHELNNKHRAENQKTPPVQTARRTRVHTGNNRQTIRD
ncbi:MAG: hypothetical protein ACYS7Y_16000 [Planctomycetota bacterium]|jgi:hypothetical protein